MHRCPFKPDPSGDHIIIADNHSCEEEQEKIRKIAAKSHKIKLLF